ncbi:hypothetical protein DPMN_026922 [Dreissena polymorpha]|uniref:Uncharacterized protein n=1 Tax=Dreissena polymorpha TaxID=45954 RepID=A0A9D4LTT9_DREPO|nr:hypothetical protein DPMN_026922 [Dreissena polymorpha]
MHQCWNRILKAFANNLDPDEMPQNMASHQDPNCAIASQVTVGEHGFPSAIASQVTVGEHGFLFGDSLRGSMVEHILVRR